METKNMEHIYQKIGEDLVNIIPEVWSKVYLYAEIGEGYKTVFFYYYPETGGAPVYNLKIPKLFNITREEFTELDIKLNDTLAELWKEFKVQNQEQWTSLTFILYKTGEMKVDYQYSNISEESPLEKKRQWEAKYLT